MANNMPGVTTGTKHSDVRPAEVLKSARMLVSATEAVENFMNPFTSDGPEQVLILSSGATHEVQNDVLRAEKVGKDAKEILIAIRLIPGCIFFESVKR